jgi:xanthine/uracil/vitamin C permease (AzgA family)
VRGDHVLLALGPVGEPTMWLALAGIIMIAVLMILQIRAAMLAGVVFVTLTAWATQMSPWPSHVLESPTLRSTFWALDFSGYYEHASTTLPCTLVSVYYSMSSLHDLMIIYTIDGLMLLS